jgi:hypothetical protein
MIANLECRLKKTNLPKTEFLADSISQQLGESVFRWYVSHANATEVVVQSTSADMDYPAHERNCHALTSNKTAAISLIPTGVGCEIGGYAGDAAPVTRLLGSAVDYLITNPNAVNASNFISLPQDVLYTDGHALDQFSQGKSHLHVPYQNRIGVIVEKSSPAVIEGIFNLINAVRAIHGVNVVDVVVTDEPIGGRCFLNEAGAFSGTVDNPHVLFSACEQLISKGATAIAVTSQVQDLPYTDYSKHFQGEFPNPVGGVEAVISYLISRRYRIPVAHAPIQNLNDLYLNEAVVDARSAGERASQSGFACILVGLNQSPHMCGGKGPCREIITRDNILAVVAPADCLGGIPALCFNSIGVPIIAVRQNRTVMRASADNLGLNNVFEVENYAEAAGLLLCMQSGINVESVYRPFMTLRPGSRESTIETDGLSLSAALAMK